MEERFADDLAGPAEAALEQVAAEVLGLARPSTTATALARRGYLARVAETELFEAARGPARGLAERLRAAGAEAPAVAGELARGEPAERPDPGDARTFSWSVPGPGGHVRHYLALGAIRTCGEPPPAAKAGDLKRCWLYGFYVRCCEEAAA